MINRLVEELDRACPGHVAEGIDAELQYLWVAGFVRHVIQMHVEGRNEVVQAAFDVIEREIAGKREHDELAIIGFLEDIQNGGLHQADSEPSDFRAYLGPKSLEAWERLNGFWGMVAGTKPV